MARRIVLVIVALHSVLVLILPYHSTLDKSRSTLCWPHKLAWKCTRIQVFITFCSILLRQSALRAQFYMRDFPISIFSMILVQDLFRTYFLFITWSRVSLLHIIVSQIPTYDHATLFRTKKIALHFLTFYHDFRRASRIGSWFRHLTGIPAYWRPPFW